MMCFKIKRFTFVLVIGRKLVKWSKLVNGREMEKLYAEIDQVLYMPYFPLYFDAKLIFIPVILDDLEKNVVERYLKERSN